MKISRIFAALNPGNAHGIGSSDTKRARTADAAETEMFDKTLSPEEIMDKPEARVGPEGRKLFEQFLRKVNELGAQRYL